MPTERMTGEVQAFTEFMKRANDSDRATLRLEVEKLRRRESEGPQVAVRMLDPVSALHQGACRSGQLNLRNCEWFYLDRLVTVICSRRKGTPPGTGAWRLAMMIRIHSLLLADEPAGNLDWKRSQSVTDLMRATPSRRRIISLVPHHERFARDADRTSNSRRKG